MTPRPKNLWLASGDHFVALPAVDCRLTHQGIRVEVLNPDADTELLAAVSSASELLFWEPLAGAFILSGLDCEITPGLTTTVICWKRPLADGLGG